MFKGSKRLRKTCPGLSIDMKEFRHKVAKNMQWTLALLKAYRGEVDGIWGSQSRAALHYFWLANFRKRDLVYEQ